MERKRVEEIQRARDEVIDVLAATLLDMILAGDGPNAEAERRVERVQDQERPSCH